MEPFVQDHESILMANHGVVTYGPDLLTAFLRMETTEHFASRGARDALLGKQVLLSVRDVEKLQAFRARYAAGAKPDASDRAGLSETCATERISLTRRELDALIDEAVRRERSHH